jgi:hypothetical protein
LYIPRSKINEDDERRAEAAEGRELLFAMMTDDDEGIDGDPY